MAFIIASREQAGAFTTIQPPFQPGCSCDMCASSTAKPSVLGFFSSMTFQRYELSPLPFSQRATWL